MAGLRTVPSSTISLDGMQHNKRQLQPAEERQTPPWFQITFWRTKLSHGRNSADIAWGQDFSQPPVQAIIEGHYQILAWQGDLYCLFICFTAHLIQHYAFPTWLSARN